MHEDDRTGKHRAHDPRGDGRGSCRATVAALGRPSRHAEVQARTRQDERKNCSCQRESGNTAAAVRLQKGSSSESVLDLPSHKRPWHHPPPARRMRLRVIFERVTFGKDPRAERWVRGDLSPDPKEACFGTVVWQARRELSERAAASGPSSMVSQTARSCVSKCVRTSPCQAQFLRKVG